MAAGRSVRVTTATDKGQKFRLALALTSFLILLKGTVEHRFKDTSLIRTTRY